MMSAQEMNNALKKKYRMLLNELNEHAETRTLLGDSFSSIYYTSTPDNWLDNDRIKIMIVGKEGYGENKIANNDEFDKLMKYSHDYLCSQLNSSNEYPINSSQFWNRIRRINESNVTICWNNLDKIHRLREQKCELSPKERAALHSIDIKILAEEINVMKPDVVIFFGWYYSSLEKELPEVNAEFNKHNDKINNEQSTAFSINDIQYIFTSHPGRKSKKYENDVCKKIENTINEIKSKR